MYVCNCNGVRAREVEAAIAAGARTAKQVLSHHGASPECCRCLKEITCRIREARASAQPLSQLVAD